MDFSSSTVEAYNTNRSTGCSVRLVIESHTITYNANGGTGSVDAQPKYTGLDRTLSDGTGLSREGYTFAGWNTQADGNGTPYAAGANYSANAAVTLYAQWTPTYTATFADGNDNTGWTIAPASGVEGTTVTVSYSGENKVKSVTVKAKPATMAGLKAAINNASDLTELNTEYLGKYVTATGALQSTSAGAVGIITYMSKSGLDTWYADSRIFVLALTDASTGAQQHTSDTPEATYTDRTALNGTQVTEHWHSWPSDFPASEAARNYSASRPSGASSWFLPSEGQWMLGGDGSHVSNVMKQTLTASHNYWTSTGNNGADNNGRVYDYTWSGIGDAQRISSYYVRAAFVY
jgi:uncharacterized repeat protein (TIGR02543 family)